MGFELKTLDKTFKRMEPKELRKMFAELEGRDLTESQRNFVKGTKKYFRRNRTLSERQLKVLIEFMQS